MGEEELTSYLTKHKVDISKFGKDGTKSIRQFSAELIRGEAQLMEDGKGQLSRIVDLIILIITKPDTNEVLVQAEQILPDKKVVPRNRLPGPKRRPDENQFLAARRFIKTHLEIDENLVKFSDNVEFIEEEKPSPSYPGVGTLYRKRFIRAEVRLPGSNPMAAGAAL